MSKSEQLEKLRRCIAEAECDPVAAFYADAPPMPTIHPVLFRQPLPVPVGGYPVDHFWAEDAEFHQSQSGEESQC